MSYSVIGVLSREKEINTVRMMAVHMDEWKEIDFLCPQLQRSWRGILLLGCSSVRPFHTLFDAQHNFRTVNATVLKFLIWIPHEKIADTCFFLDRIMPLFRVMAL